MADRPATPDAIARHPIDPPRRLLESLRYVGPGLILAGAIVGTGELIATTNLGARAGFSLLWLVILSCVIKVFVQVELGRYAIASGEGTYAAFQRLPGPGAMLVWWCMGMMLVTQFQIGAMIGGVGQALHIAMPGLSQSVTSMLEQIAPGAAEWLRSRPEFPWATITTVATIIMLSTGSYSLVEKGTTAMVVVFTIMTVGCMVLLPPAIAPTLSDFAHGLSFQLPKEHVVAALTMFGITGVGASELLAYPYWCIEKGYAQYTGPNDPSESWSDRARGWIRVMHLDAWLSMLIYLTATIAFFILGAAILHEETGGGGLPDSVAGMLKVLSAMYRPVLGQRVATWFIVIGAFAVLYSTLFAATAGNSRLIADFSRLQGWIPRDSPKDFRNVVRLGCCILPTLGFVLYLAVQNPVLMVTIGGVMQALSLPPIAAAAVFLRYRRTDRRLLPGRAWDLFLWASLAGLCAAAVVTGWLELRKLLGWP